jgi:hypothetical protein
MKAENGNSCFHPSAFILPLSSFVFRLASGPF